MKSNSNYNLQNQDLGCKIFVGGLTWNTTKDMLHNEFSNFGDIVDSIVMKNPETGNSRGFGFVTYKENSSAENAVASGSHKIDGKIVDVKLCNPKLAAQQRNIKQKSDNCKVFVGGLPHGVTDDQIKQFFSRYGPVTEFKMMYDENKQRPRGFGFITFEMEECANQVLQEHYIQFNGKQIEVKPQIHNIKQQIPYQQHQHMQFQQSNAAHFSGGGAGTNYNWNQQSIQGGQQQGQQQQQQHQGQQQQMSGLNSSYGNMPMPQQGFNPNPQAANWGGYQGNGSQQQIQFSGANSGGTQSNWNYQYYNQSQPQQPQQGYYQQQQQQQPQQQQQHQQQLQGQGQDSQTATGGRNLNDNEQHQSIILTSQPDPPNPNNSNFRNKLTSEYIQDSFLPKTAYKQSSSSSIAGTIGSNANCNYSDSETSTHSYYRGNSLGSNSSQAPSVNSLTSSSIVSNCYISGNSSNNSSSSTTSSNNNSTGFSNQNHHRINTQNIVNTNRGIVENRNSRNRNNPFNGHGHNRSGGSVGSSSATDISSVYSSVPSQLNVAIVSDMIDDMSENLYQISQSQSSVGQLQQGHSSSSSYHPYRR